MTPSPRPRRKRTVTLTYQDFERMCLNHNLEDIDAQAFWKAALDLPNNRQPTEVAALTRPQIEDIFHAEFCMDRDDADKFWDAAIETMRDNWID